MIIHLVDGTYELFRHFYGQRRFNKGQDKPFGAVAGSPSFRRRLITLRVFSRPFRSHGDKI